MNAPTGRRVVVAWVLASVAILGALLLAVTMASIDVDARVPTSYPAIDVGARVIDLAAGLGLILAGIFHLVVRRRPAAIGAIGILLGIHWLAADVVGWQSGPILVRSGAMSLAPFAIPLLAQLVTVQLEGPSPRVAKRRLILLGYAIFASTSAARAVTWDPVVDPTCWMNCAGNAFLVAANPALARGIEVAWMAAALVGGLGIAGLAINGLLTRTRPGRVLAAPILLPLAGLPLAHAGYGLLGLILPPEVPENPAFFVSYLTRGAGMVALATGIAWTTAVALQRSRAVARLAADLAERSEPGSFQAALRRSLGDPALEVAYWLPSHGRHVDADGHSVDPSRWPAAATITRDGAPLAIVRHDPGLVAARELEEEIGAAARVALDNERLRAEILAQLDDLRQARTAIVKTGDAARRRLERDLHDGVQQRLLAAAYELQLAQAAPTVPRDDGRLVDALETTRRALREIRSLAQGIHPLILTEAGLAAALNTFAEESTIPLEISIGPGQRYPEPVETTAYAVVLEAVHDAVSHGATYCAISARSSDGQLTIRIEDDGAAREAPPIVVADRVGAIGGTVTREARAMSMELPCE